MVEHVILTSPSVQIGTLALSNRCRQLVEDLFGLRDNSVVRTAKAKKPSRLSRAVASVL